MNNNEILRLSLSEEEIVKINKRLIDVFDVNLTSYPKQYDKIELECTGKRNCNCYIHRAK